MAWTMQVVDLELEAHEGEEGNFVDEIRQANAR